MIEKYFKKIIKKEYALSGKLKEEYETLYNIQTEEAIRDGIYKKYIEGNLSLEQKYRDGVLNGKSMKYLDGELYEYGNYVNGLKEGIWIKGTKKYVYLKGEVQKEPEYENTEENFKEKSREINILNIFCLTIIIIGIIGYTIKNF